jgi:hypothetical protein
MFDGESARGPVPRLFATNPAEARGNLASDPARAHKDLQRIMARITINENIPAHAAFELILNPRLTSSPKTYSNRPIPNKFKLQTRILGH